MENAEHLCSCEANRMFQLEPQIEAMLYKHIVYTLCGVKDTQVESSLYMKKWNIGMNRAGTSV